MLTVKIPGVYHVRVLLAGAMPDLSIERSRGFIDCHADPSLKPRYIEDAVAPTSEWEQVAFKTAISSGGHDGRSISVFRIDDDFLSYLRNVLETASSDDDVRAALVAVEEGANSLFATSGLPRGEMRLRGFFENPPDRITLTWDAASSRHVGLHLDSFEGISPAGRFARPPRASLNIGNGHRYLLFCDATAQQVADHARVHGFDGLPLNQQIRHFLLSDAEAFTYRVRLPPGHGYLASTENIVHEGSNLGSKEIDRTVVFFSQSALKAASEIAAA